MKGFFQWWRKNTPDVLSGWNICSDFKVNITGGFDLPYIINRSKVLFGEDSSDYRKLSPIGIVNCFYKKEADTFSIDIAGISVLDYMALYKWYTTKNLESYSLETVCQHELGEGKLSYEGDLNDLYEGDYNKYVEYNIKDVRLIKRLEEKLNYILLAQSLCLLCKCPMKNYNSTTNLVEGLMLTRFRRAGKCAPYFAGGHQSEFEGGFVKPPIVGKHNWIFGMDITSSYPFAMITLNMSQETLYGKITGFNNEEVKNFVRNNNFPEFRLIKNNNIIEIKDKLLISFNKAIEKKLFSISPNGVVFHNSPIGSYASMIRDVFLKRKELKRKMAKKKKQYKETPSEKLKNEINVLNTTQWAQKIIINGSYGCSSVPYSRYFSQDIAEAITSVGQESLKSGIRFVNDLLNKPNKELMDIINSISVENV
jgi:DNA polymerase elongation subunit (family B)